MGEKRRDVEDWDPHPVWNRFSGEGELPSGSWLSLMDTGKTFLTSLLAKKYEDRPGMQAAKGDPWFQDERQRLEEMYERIIRRGEMYDVSVV